MKKLFFIVAAAFLMSCGGPKSATTSTPPGAPTPTESDLARGKQHYSDLTMETLTEGKATFEKQCTVCHSMKNPTSRTPEQWNDIVPKMVAKANKKAGSEIITPQLQESILKYVVTMSKG